jgi:penicillin-binding protein 1A
MKLGIGQDSHVPRYQAIRNLPKTSKKAPAPRRTGFFTRFLQFTLVLLLVAAAAGTFGAYALYSYLEPQLPDIEVLSDVRYQMPMSIYTKSGKLIAQFGEKKREPLNFEQIPQTVVDAFLAAEDDRFFDHPGVDYQGLVRAAVLFARTGEKRQGGSTITMQVARNFFLSSEKTFFRKLKEIMLAMKIESRLPKRQILELYLNKIYFGHHAYGVEAAAQVYYGKHVNELSLAEVAMIAGLPKAPSAFNPLANPERALIRRNYVLKRMQTLGRITEAQYREAIAEPVNASLHTVAVEFYAPYVAEMVRAEMYAQYGEDAYVNGYKVYTTVDERLQNEAKKAVRDALHEYDERHGYRGAKQQVDLRKIRSEAEWDEQLAGAQRLGDTIAGLVTAVSDSTAEVYLGHSQRTTLAWDGVRWARKYINADAAGAYPRSVREVLKPGDIVRLRSNQDGSMVLAQVPSVEGSLVSLDPSSGAILAIVGGYDWNHSKFNRATQSRRQPGSGFKPILYTAALEKGFTPASVVNDAPFVFYDPAVEGGVWKPQNFGGKFYGPTRLRVALAKSRNLVSIRLLREVGLKRTIETAKKFGFTQDELPRSLSLALGSGTATPLRMAQAYSAFANGGFRVEPYIIEKILRQNGETLYEATPSVACADCAGDSNVRGNLAPRVMSPQVHYMMHSMLQDVVRIGTATRAMSLGRSDLAGKTGTTNDQRDTWFNGYTPSLVTICWMGFDSYQPLGEGETGGHSALPMWIAYMREALQDVPEKSFDVPDGLTTVRIDPGSGLLAPAGSSRGVFEIFPSDRVPKYYAAPAVSERRSEDEAGTAGAGGEAAPPRQERAAKSLESLF